MPEYRVVWEIDVDANSPREAATIARGYQTARGMGVAVALVVLLLAFIVQVFN